MIINSGDMPVDLVYLWVDGSDPKWQEKRNKRLGKVEEVSEINCKGRYANNDELMFSLRSVEKYAPWIRKIFIVTDDQVPEWLDTSNPKVRIVDHKEIMPAESLPCFNSTAIEHFLHNIPDLSEHFIFANDDMMLNKPVSKSDFFNADGDPVMRLVRRPCMRFWSWFQINILRKKMGLYKTIIRNSAILVNKRFGKYYESKPHHNMDSYRKSYMKHVEDIFKEEFSTTFSNPLRSDDEYQRIIYYYTGMAEGKGVRIYTDKDISFQLSITKDYHYKQLMEHDPVFFCMNDSPKATDAHREAAKKYLAGRFPDKSHFEK